MSDVSSWSLSGGRWRRVHLRVHALFVAVAVLVMYLITGPAGQDSVGYGALAVAILFFSVVAHEAGHCLAAVRLGGNPEQIVIGPLGGLNAFEVPRDPRAELIKALAGPIVNLAIVLALLPVVLGANLGISHLLSPLEPTGLLDGPWWAVCVKLGFWINGLLLTVNLLPAIPFDGSRILLTLLWPAVDYRTAAHVVVRASKLTALGICVLAWLLGDVQSADLLPAWVPLVLLAVFIYFHAAHDAMRLEESDWDEDLLNYDFSQGYTSLERNAEPNRKPGSSLWQWLAHQRDLRQRRRQFREQDEERQVDEILLRLHQGGMKSLTAKQRALLQRVSTRYRNRQRS
jgi:stage IV sporulation protein FB